MKLNLLGAAPAGKAMKAASFKDPAIVKAPDSELIAAVKNGKNKMPAYTRKLTDDQIKAAVAWIRTLEKQLSISGSGCSVPFGLRRLVSPDPLVCDPCHRPAG